MRILGSMFVGVCNTLADAAPDEPGFREMVVKGYAFEFGFHRGGEPQCHAIGEACLSAHFLVPAIEPGVTDIGNG
jgi:hypothetical protein